MSAALPSLALLATHLSCVADEGWRSALPNAAIGANYSPTEFMTDTRDGQSYCNAYLGNTFQWLRNFKEGGSTLPWSEDCETTEPLHQTISSRDGSERAGVNGCRAVADAARHAADGDARH